MRIYLQESLTDSLTNPVLWSVRVYGRENVHSQVPFSDTSLFHLSPAILVAMTFVPLFAGLCQVAMALLICHTKCLVALNRCWRLTEIIYVWSRASDQRRWRNQSLWMYSAWQTKRKTEKRATISKADWWCSFVAPFLKDRSSEMSGFRSDPSVARWAYVRCVRVSIRTVWTALSTWECCWLWRSELPEMTRDTCSTGARDFCFVCCATLSRGERPGCSLRYHQYSPMWSCLCAADQIQRTFWV